MLVRVLTFNIRNGLAEDGVNCWDNRRHLTAAAIRNAAPDVIGLQEVYDFQLAYLTSELPEYEFYSVGREDGISQGEHCSILWRKDRFQRVKAGTFWLSDSPDLPNSMSWGNRIARICSWVEFAEGFRFYNTHWDHESELSRQRSAELILEVLPDSPWVLVGDFNADSESADLECLLSSPRVNFVTRSNRIGTFHDFCGGSNGVCIDHILCSSGIEPSNLLIIVDQKDEGLPSDHHPVACLLTIFRG